LFESGELEEKLGVEGAPTTPPRLSVTERARGALLEALESDTELVRLDISPAFEHALSIGPVQKGDLVVELGTLKVALGRSSAARADGVSIDFVETGEGPAFKITNPNEPARVQALSVRELKQKLDQGAAVTLLDVRTPKERAIASIAGSRLLDDLAAEELMELDRETPLVFYCHHGMRSRQAAEHFLREGFKNVFNLSGGIDAWSQEIDRELPRY